jgi:hypothetical protein
VANPSALAYQKTTGELFDVVQRWRGTETLSGVIEYNAETHANSLITPDVWDAAIDAMTEAGRLRARVVNPGGVTIP